MTFDPIEILKEQALFFCLIVFLGCFYLVGFSVEELVAMGERPVASRYERAIEEGRSPPAAALAAGGAFFKYHWNRLILNAWTALQEEYSRLGNALAVIVPPLANGLDTAPLGALPKKEAREFVIIGGFGVAFACVCGFLCVPALLPPTRSRNGLSYQFLCVSVFFFVIGTIFQWTAMSLIALMPTIAGTALAFREAVNAHQFQRYL